MLAASERQEPPTSPRDVANLVLPNAITQELGKGIITAKELPALPREVANLVLPTDFAHKLGKGDILPHHRAQVKVHIAKWAGIEAWLYGNRLICQDAVAILHHAQQPILSVYKKRDASSCCA